MKHSKSSSILLIFVSLFISFNIICASDVDAAESGKHLEKRNTELVFLNTKDCGTRKNCFISPHDCDTNRDKCNFVLKWDFDGKLINYELTAITKSWASILFSEDKTIGNDNLIACLRQGDKVSINHYYKQNTNSELVHLRSNEDGLLNKDGKYEKGIINCTFSREIYTGNKLINNLNVPHYIHVGTGNQNEIITEQLVKTFQPSELQSPIKFSVVTKPHVPTSWLVKFHGTFMIIAWIFFASIGILLARYYKPMWPHNLISRVRVWFAFHRSILSTVVVLTLIGFIFILIEMRFTWSSHGHALTHSILGIIVICLALMNPILGFLRPKPDTKLRCVFFWFHWLIGTVAYCLSVPTVFIGMDQSKLDLPNWCAWLLFAWVIFHIIVELCLEIHYCCTYQTDDEYLTEYSTLDKTVIVQKKKNPPGYKWKPALLFIYAAVTAIVVSIIVIAIIFHDYV